MDPQRFDTLTRSLHLHDARSRRRVLTTLLAIGCALGLSPPENAAAKKKPCPPCKKRKKGKCKKKLPDNTACTGGTCQSGNCIAAPAPPPPPCVPESQAATCAGAACNTARNNNCGQAVACICPTGQDCLVNGSCAIPCTTGGDECPDACAGCSIDNVEGQQYCLAPNSECATLPECNVTTGTSGCDLGSQCQECIQGPTIFIRCAPLCTG